MEINFTLINEIISFIFFFFFFLLFIVPKIINDINNKIILNYKNKNFFNYNKTFQNKLFNKIFLIEYNVKNNIKKYINDINFLFIKKNIFFKNAIENEKKFLIKIIKIKINFINFNLKKKNIYNIKLYFLKSFKKIYNEIINYNNNFILL